MHVHATTCYALHQFTAYNCQLVVTLCHNMAENKLQLIVILRAIRLCSTRHGKVIKNPPKI